MTAIPIYRDRFSCFVELRAIELRENVVDFRDRFTVGAFSKSHRPNHVGPIFVFCRLRVGQTTGREGN